LVNLAQILKIIWLTQVVLSFNMKKKKKRIGQLASPQGKYFTTVLYLKANCSKSINIPLERTFDLNQKFIMKLSQTFV
jgi:hypothetical protein